MSAKSLKFFGPPTTKWRPCKIFAKLNGNHLLMVIIFKLHQYQTFSLMRNHNIWKVWFANKIFSLSKSLVYDWRAVEYCIFNFCFSPSPKFQITIVKNLAMDFDCSIRHKYFWTTHLWQGNGGTFNYFWNLHEYAFCFFIFFKMKKTLQPLF